MARKTEIQVYVGNKVVTTIKVQRPIYKADWPYCLNSK